MPSLFFAQGKGGEKRRESGDEKGRGGENPMLSGHLVTEKKKEKSESYYIARGRKEGPNSFRPSRVKS